MENVEGLLLEMMVIKEMKCSLQDWEEIMELCYQLISFLMYFHCTTHYRHIESPSQSDVITDQ